MGKLGLGAIAALFGLTAAACGQGDDRPAALKYDGGGASGGISGGGTGGAAGGGSGGSAGGCVPNPQEGSVVSGNVITYDVLLGGKQPFQGQAELTAPGENCPFVSTTWDGAAPGVDGGAAKFVLEAVKAEKVWTLIEQLPSSNAAVYPTLLLLDATADTDIIDGVGMIRSNSVDEAYTALGIPRDPNKGTMIVQLLAPLTNQPQFGGQVDVGGAGSAAYPAAGSWSLGGQTDASGIAVMLNTSALPYPGQTLNVHVKVDAVEKTLECRSASGVVSVCFIGIGTT